MNGKRILLLVCAGLLSATSVAKTVDYIVIEDNVTSLEATVDLDKPGAYQFELDGKLLTVDVQHGDKPRVVSTIIDKESGEVLSTATQGGDYPFSGPNLYLFCDGSLHKRVAPAADLSVSCDT